MTPAEEKPPPPPSLRDAAERAAAELFVGREQELAELDVSERARKAVANRIRDAIDKIGKENRALALHLKNSIRTGAFCSYRPDRSPGWNF